MAYDSRESRGWTTRGSGSDGSGGHRTHGAEVRSVRCESAHSRSTAHSEDCAHDASSVTVRFLTSAHNERGRTKSNARRNEENSLVTLYDTRSTLRADRHEKRDERKERGPYYNEDRSVLGKRKKLTSDAHQTHIKRGSRRALPLV